MQFLYEMIFMSLTVARRVSHVEQELLTGLEHMCKPLVLSGVRVAQCLAFSFAYYCMFFFFCCP